MLDLEKYPKIYDNIDIDGGQFAFCDASILLTEDCNLRCTYCFENHNKNKMSESTADKAVDFIFENARKSGQNRCGFTMFGGEPMMAADIFERMVRRAWKIEDETGIESSFTVITNGTFLPDNIAQLMRESIKINRLIGVQISSDGPAHVHDKYRVTVAGGPSFHMVEKTIEKYKEVYGDYFKQVVNIHGCLNAETVGDLFESYKYFRENLGFQRIWFLPVTEENWTEDHVKIYFEQMKLIKEYIMKIVDVTQSIREIEINAPLDRCLRQPNNRISIPCGAGRNYCSITANGELYPCHNIYFNDANKDSLIGNIWTGVDENATRIYKQYDPEDISNCVGCDHGYCYRCIAINLSENGSLFAQVRGNYCKMMKVDNYFQKQMRKEIEEMGLISNTKNNGYKLLTKAEAGYDCGEVYEDFGKCHLVDVTSDEWKAVKDLPEGVYPEGYVKPEKKPFVPTFNDGKIVEKWEKNGVHYERIILKDGSIKVIEKEKKNDSILDKINLELNKNNKNGNDSCCGGNCHNDDSEFEQTVVESLTFILKKLEGIEKYLNK